MSFASTLLLAAPEDPAPPPDPEGVLGTLAHWAENFIAIFQAGADTFVALLTGIIPLLIVLLTAVNALIKLVGPERIDSFGAFAARPGFIYLPLRYMRAAVPVGVLPDQPHVLHDGPVPSRAKKPAFYDADGQLRPPDPRVCSRTPTPANTSSGPASPPASPRTDLPIGDLAVRYLLVGLVVIFLRGCTTEIIFRIMSRRTPKAQVA